MKYRSLNVPGSPSSMFTANNLGPSNFRTMSHFIPAGNPAPPNPLRFEFFKTSMTSSAFFSPQTHD